MITKLIKAPVCEIFESIQGEGPNIGVPTTFIRFFGCNLRCQFDGESCDTPYSVIKDGKVTMYTPHSLYREIRENKSELITFTGGEPMLYQEFMEAFMRVVSNERRRNYSYEVETNGTVAPTDYVYVNCNFNISVKLKSSYQKSRMYDKRRVNYKALNAYPENRSHYKFVYCEREDIYEIMKILNKTEIKSVYLMPQGITRNEIVKNSPMVVNYCMEHNWTFCPREHIIIWNNKKGV